MNPFAAAPFAKAPISASKIEASLIGTIPSCPTAEREFFAPQKEAGGRLGCITTFPSMLNHK